MVRPPYGNAAHLVGIAAQHWQAIDGEAASRGADFLQLPFDRFLNVIFWWSVQRVKDVEHFQYDLEKPFPLPMEAFVAAGSLVTEAELDADAASFMAFAGAFGVAPPAARPPSGGDGRVPSEPSA